MWIPVTLAAAVFQILRTSRQHALRGVLSTNGAGFVRYAYGFPLAVVAALVTFPVLGRDIPSVSWKLWAAVAVGGGAQILATIALLASFRHRDFAIGTVYAKTEVIQVGLVSAVVLGEPFRPLGWVAAVVCMVGVMWLAAPGGLGQLIDLAGDRAAVLGVAAGGLFGVAAVFIRVGSTSIDTGTTWDRALVTLTAMLGIQTVVNGGQLRIRHPEEFRAVFRHWREALPVGVLSLAGSAGWATAVTLANAARVRTLGQVEIVIAFAVSVLVLRERHSRAEYLASALVTAGVVGVIAVG